MREHLSELDSALPLGRKGIFMLTSQVIQVSTRERRGLHKETESPLVSILNVKWCAWYQWLHDSMSECYQSINHNWQFQSDNKNPEGKQAMLLRKLLVSATQLERPHGPGSKFLGYLLYSQLPFHWVNFLPVESSCSCCWASSNLNRLDKR